MSVHSETESEGGGGEVDGRGREVWQTVQVSLERQLHGPTMAIIRDPVSNWIVAELLPETEEEARAVASFMLRTFFSFGFPKIELHNFDTLQFEEITSKYLEMVEQATALVPQVRGIQTDLLLKSGKTTLPDGLAISQSREELAARLFGLRVGIDGDQPASTSPFQMMFSRAGLVKREEEVQQTRRKLQSSVLHCRHCAETFTSKISFRIHQRRHTEEARLRGQREGEAARRLDESVEAEEDQVVEEGSRKRRLGRADRLRQQKKKRLARLASVWQQPETRDLETEEVVGQAAAAVQALLHATREERLKRGKYLRYSPQLRDEIAEFAIQHGHAAAAQHFTRRLSSLVSESSVRNFVTLYQNFSHQLRHEIGRVASERGLEATAAHYTARLGRPVSRSLVRRFRNQFGVSPLERAGGKVRTSVGKPGKIYNQPLREEIGRYAAQHGVEATVQVYTEKLLVPVKASTVRKFRRLFGDLPPADMSACVQLSESSSTTIDLLHSSMHVLNQQAGPYLPPPSYPPPPPQQYSAACPLSLVTEPQNSETLVDTVEKTEQTEKEETKGKGEEKGKGKASASSRGRYSQYTPELRAKIGKFALKHGNAAAVRHFQAELGHEIPESTIRGMRDKYQVLSEQQGGGVAEVGCGPRGRPVSLGPYDNLVQVGSWS